MARLKSRCPDADLLRLVNRFLKAGVSVDGRIEPTGPLLVQHPFCKFVTCWFCEGVSAVAMRARSARRAKDGTPSRRNFGRQHPQAISSGHFYLFL